MIWIYLWKMRNLQKNNSFFAFIMYAALMLQKHIKRLMEWIMQQPLLLVIDCWKKMVLKVKLCGLRKTV